VTIAGLPSPPRLSRLRFWSLVASTVGLFTALSFAYLIRPSPERAMSTGHLLQVLAVEAGLAAVWLPLLRRDGWTMRAVTRPWTPSDLVHGLSLWLYAWLTYYAAWMGTSLVAPAFTRAAAAAGTFGGRPAWWAVILSCLTNPAAEELLYLAVIARTLEPESRALALAGCTVARVLVHVYQGPFAIVSVLPTGLIFGAYYLYTHRIWPVVVAHATMNLLAFGLRAGAAR
jgi:membrane protease YdiL (CAAX protease family)